MLLNSEMFDLGVRLLSVSVFSGPFEVGDSRLTFVHGLLLQLLVLCIVRVRCANRLILVGAGGAPHSKLRQT